MCPAPLANPGALAVVAPKTLASRTPSDPKSITIFHPIVPIFSGDGGNGVSGSAERTVTAPLTQLEVIIFPSFETYPLVCSSPLGKTASYQTTEYFPRRAWPQNQLRTLVFSGSTPQFYFRQLDSSEKRCDPMTYLVMITYTLEFQWNTVNVKIDFGNGVGHSIGPSHTRDNL